MKSLITLWQEVANDYATFCGTTTTQDARLVLRRCQKEGSSFLTITLPDFGKGFEEALDRGRVLPSDVTAFKWRRGLPLFLRGFLELIFDSRSGKVLDSPNYDAIQGVRQLCYLYSKMSADCSDTRKSNAYQAYIQCEKELKRQHSPVKDRDRDAALRNVSTLLFSSMFSRLDQEAYSFSFVPNHGPGATTDRLIGNHKWRQLTWTSRLERSFPYVEYALPNARYIADCLEEVEFLEPADEPPVKVVLVPKTMKSPRVIAIESTAMQYCQQSIRGSLYREVENDPLWRDLFGFQDQTPNQRLAQIGSRDGHLATLDLKEASDRVTLSQVEHLLADFPYLKEAVLACRSTQANVNGEVVNLVKFASMGSALTFPLEAIVFFVTIVLARLRQRGFTYYTISQLRDRRLIFDVVKRMRGNVRVFGDDIVVPTDLVSPVLSVFEDFHFLVNGSKSFWTGRFRESCGKEYYEGQDVSILKFRLDSFPEQADVARTARLVEFRNLAYCAGLWKTARWIDGQVANLIKYYPNVDSTSSVVGRYSYLGYDCQRLDPDTQVPQVKGHRVVSRIPTRRISGAPALLKCLVSSHEDPMHLERSGRPSSVYIKTGWSRAY